MRGCLSFIYTLAIIALLISVVCWIFTSDFLIFDLLLMLGMIILPIIVVLIVIVGVVWFIKEFFG